MSLRALTLLLLVGCTGTTLPGATDAPDPVQSCAAEQCGAVCTDIDWDPRNCGDCGISCVVPNAEATCDLGECALGSCEFGWADCDGDPLNGCEAESLCVQGASCATTCGSSGTQDCTDACAPVCEPPAEICNLIDDDCDGACDEEVEGCRSSIYRSHGPLGHLYGQDPNEARMLGQNIEAARYFDVMVRSAPGTRALYRCDKGGGRRFLTTSSQCEGLEKPPDLTLGYIGSSAVCGSTPLYRMYSGAAQNHFYTISASERDRAKELGYRVEGTVGYVWLSR